MLSSLQFLLTGGNPARVHANTGLADRLQFKHWPSDVRCQGPRYILYICTPSYTTEGFVWCGCTSGKKYRRFGPQSSPCRESQRAKPCGICSNRECRGTDANHTGPALDPHQYRRQHSPTNETRYIWWQSLVLYHELVYFNSLNLHDQSNRSVKLW